MSKNKIIGVDLGGNKVESILMDCQGKIYEKVRLKTEAHKTRLEILNNIFNCVSPLYEKHKKDLQGIGFGIPGFVNEAGKIIHLPNIQPLLNINLKDILQKRYKTKISIANDASCFGLAEFMFGAGKGANNMIGVIWGTGVGGGIIINKKLYLGKFGAAGEIGFMRIMDKQTARNLGYKDGMLEYLCGYKYLKKRYHKMGGQEKNPYLSNFGYKGKDPTGKKVINESLDHMSGGLANLYNIFAPDIVVLGGGMSNIPDILYDKLQKQTVNKVINALKSTVKIRRYKISDSSGAIGAGILTVLNKN